MRVVDFFKWEFELVSPTAISAPERNLKVDIPVAVDGDDNPYIPPSSLAGSLRAHLGDLAAVMMGPTPDIEDPENLTPSQISILGTSLSGDISLDTIRQSAVDRLSGSAADKMLYDSQAIAPGALLTVYGMAEVRGDGVDEHTLSDGLNGEAIEMLGQWQPVLGRRRTTGQGQTKSLGFWTGRLDLSQPEDLKKWLSLGGPGLVDAVAKTPHQPPARDRDRVFDVLFTIEDQLHIGTGEKSPKEAAPIRRDHAGNPVMPGSAWKGVIRSRMMFIIESLSPGRCANAGQVTTDNACDCPACTLFGTTQQRGLLTFTDSPITDAIIEEQPHVAIDRFTGGAADGKLWTDEIATSGTLNLCIGSDIDLTETHENLLRHVVRDLHDGLIGIGGQTSRGSGTIVVSGDPPEVRPITDEDLA